MKKQKQKRKKIPKKLEGLFTSSIAMVKKNKMRLIKIRVESLKMPVTEEDALQIEFIFLKDKKWKK